MLCCMRRLLLCLLCLPFLQMHAADNIEALYQRLLSSVVIVSHERGIGTGFVIDRDRIATNVHVIDGAQEITITFLDNQERKKVRRVVKQNAEYDLAILDADTRTRDALPLASDDAVVVGRAVYALGNPRGLTASISNGMIGALRNFDARGALVQAVESSRADWIQTTAAVNPGNSGGPLVLGDGRVVGVITFKQTGLDGIGFASHVRLLRRLSGTSSRRSGDIGGASSNPVTNERMSQAEVDQAVNLIMAQIFPGAIVGNVEELSPRAALQMLSGVHTDREALLAQVAALPGLADDNDARNRVMEGVRQRFDHDFMAFGSNRIQVDQLADLVATELQAELKRDNIDAGFELLIQAETGLAFSLTEREHELRSIEKRYRSQRFARELAHLSPPTQTDHAGDKAFIAQVDAIRREATSHDIELQPSAEMTAAIKAARDRITADEELFAALVLVVTERRFDEYADAAADMATLIQNGFTHPELESVNAQLTSEAPWAAARGEDEQGRWADVQLGTQRLLRLRHVEISDTHAVWIMADELSHSDLQALELGTQQIINAQQAALPVVITSPGMIDPIIATLAKKTGLRWRLPAFSEFEVYCGHLLPILDPDEIELVQQRYHSNIGDPDAPRATGESEGNLFGVRDALGNLWEPITGEDGLIMAGGSYRLSPNQWYDTRPLDLSNSDVGLRLVCEIAAR